MSRVRVEVVTDDATLARLEGEWHALLACTPLASGFQSFAWIAACRGHLATSRRLHTLVVRDGGEVVGILPCELGANGELSLIGGPVTNYQGPVYRPERVHDVAGALADFVGAARDRIRLLDFHGLREGSPFLAAWAGRDLPGWEAPRLVRTATCPVLDLTPGWKAIYGRRSVRKFKPDPVPRELVRQVMHAGIWAPSSCNYQMWDFVAVDDAEVNRKLAALSLQMGNAPVNIVVAYGREFSEEGFANVQSASAAIENMSLAAQVLGLGTFWITQMGDREKVRETVGLPEDFTPVGVIPIGHPLPDQKSPSLKRSSAR